ncbi:peroxidase 4-like [Tripterygium wilfordii]|uniref:peroxidase 4-like n=1 Tax=Tripterygium wilfordii TaxID=458696 RepID=UPI0018F81E63|nr:peroxidase 4-like [Tripterygium wilfordii]
MFSLTASSRESSAFVITLDEFQLPHSAPRVPNSIIYTRFPGKPKENIYKEGESHSDLFSNWSQSPSRPYDPLGVRDVMARFCLMLTMSPLDLVTPNSFDNNYFKNLIQKKGLLHSDQVLFSGGSTDKIVYEYSKNPSLFNSDFASAMIKMGNIDVLTGSSGEIRKICSAVN